MCGIKIPQQDFVLKMQEELICKEGVGGICRTLQYRQPNHMPTHL